MADTQPITSGPHGHQNPLFLGHYSRGCRCEECREAHRRYHRKRRASHPGANAKAQREYRERQKAIDPKHSTRWYHAKATSPAFRAGRAKKMSERAASRREMLAKIKVERGCVDCGYREHFAALDFDHTTGKKVANLSAMVLQPVGRIMAEVEKCVVRCYRCHRVKTRRDMAAWVRKRVASPSAGTRKMARYRERGWAFLAEWKLKHGCADCGYDAHAEALDFDHVRGEKMFDISQRPQYTIARLTAEIAKCEVVCANCHRARTYRRLNPAG